MDKIKRAYNYEAIFRGSSKDLDEFASNNNSKGWLFQIVAIKNRWSNWPI